MSKYLHFFDLKDELKCLNLCSTRTLSSLLVNQLVTEDRKPNPMSLSIDSLENYRIEDIDGLSSPRMYFIYQKALLRLKSLLSEKEEKEIRVANAEIEFERRRREIAPGAPSRLSCLYLVENNIDGRVALVDMFQETAVKPMYMEVDIFGKHLELMKFDYKWYNMYRNEPREEYINNYWNGVQYNNNYESWEYLLEGTIVMTNEEQLHEVEEYSRTHYIDRYSKI